MKKPQHDTPPDQRAPAQEYFARAERLLFDTGNFQEALRLYEKAAHEGHLEAHLRCALILGTLKNEADSLKWERKAAALGYPPAQCLLAVKYELGRGVPKDPAEALSYGPGFASTHSG